MLVRFYAERERGTGASRCSFPRALLLRGDYMLAGQSARRQRQEQRSEPYRANPCCRLELMLIAAGSAIGSSPNRNWRRFGPLGSRLFADTAGQGQVALSEHPQKGIYEQVPVFVGPCPYNARRQMAQRSSAALSLKIVSKRLPILL